LRKLLYLAYPFPPMGGVGVVRTAKFARYLPEHGWRVHVLTVDEAVYHLHDESLLSEIPEGTKVTRVRGREWRRLLRRHRGSTDPTPSSGAGPPGPLRRLAGLLADKLVDVPDAQAPWSREAARVAKKLAREDPPDAILATQPNSTLVAGAGLARELHLPMVADFRDEWTRDSFWKGSWWPRSAFERRLEGKVLRCAARVLCNTPGMRRNFLADHPGFPPRRFTVIPNGFDPADFEENARELPKPLTIAYTGSFYHRHHPYRLLEAAGASVAEGGIPREELRIVLAGSFEHGVAAGIAKRIRDLGLDDVVSTPGHLPYRESLRLLTSSHLLLFMLYPGPGSACWVPAKLYQYLGAARPILAICPEGDAREILEASGAAVAIAPPDDVGAIRDALEGVHTAWREGRLGVQADRAEIGRYERRAIAGELAGVLEEAVGDPV
jgi:glycosyltransferase involved in cell wall biosynthesis